jgi:hypothetical protein
MRVPAITYRHGYNHDRRGSNTGVSPHCFTAHPVIGSETRHYTHLTLHCLSSVTLEGGYDKARIPRSRGFGLIRPALTRPRPSLDDQRSSTGKKGQRGTVFRVISPSHLRRHHGVQGWPAIPATRRYSHPYKDRQNITSRLPGVLASSYPIKGQARTLQTKNGRTDKPQARSQALASKSSQSTDQHLKQSPLYSFFSL